MVWRVSADIQQIIEQGGHDIRPRVSVVHASGSGYDIPILDESSSVTASIGQRIGRTFGFAINRSVIDSGTLDVLTDLLYVRCQVGDHTDIPLGVFRPVDATDTETGHVAIRCNDLADDIVNDDFIIPWAVGPDYIGPEFQRIIQDSNMTYNVDYSRAPLVYPAAGQVWSTSRGQALDDLATAGNCMWQADRVGGFTLYPNPYVGTIAPLSVMTLTDGQNGVIVSVSHIASRAEIVNAITLIVERVDNSPPIRVTVYDNDPRSRTYYFGPFGKRNKIIDVRSGGLVQGLGTEALALSVAQRLLRQYLAMTETWTITTPFYPLLDQGDVITLWYNDIVNLLVVESIQIPINSKTATKITARRLQLMDPTTIGLA